jgi:hypothetical protein
MNNRKSLLLDGSISRALLSLAVPMRWSEKVRARHTRRRAGLAVWLVTLRLRRGFGSGFGGDAAGNRRLRRRGFNPHPRYATARSS